MIIRELITRLGWSVETRGADAYDRRLRQTEGVARRLVSSLRGMAVNIAIYNEITDSIGQMAVKLADTLLLIPRAGAAMSASINVMNTELQNTGLAVETYEKLYQAVRQTGAGMDDSARAFARYQGAMNENGKSVQDTVDLITGLQAAMSMSGLNTAEMNSITTQLSQALGSGTLSGDEYKSLRENMPQLVRFLRDELKMSGAEIKKAAEDQQLTTEKLLDPLLKFARKAREDLANAPLDMNSEWANLGTTFVRFIADLDRTFRLSDRIARALRGVSDMLERWRQYIPMLAAMIDRMGGLQSSAIALGIVLAGFAVYAIGIQRVGAAFMLVARGILAAMAPIAAMVAAFLIIEDFISWVQGKKSVFGDLFGSFGDVTAGLSAQFAGVRQVFVDTFGSFESIVAGLKAQFEATRASVVAAFNSPEAAAGIAALRDLGTAAWNAILVIVEATARELAGLLGWLSTLTGAFAAGGETATGAIGAINIGINDLGGFIRATLGEIAALGALFQSVAAAASAGWGGLAEIFSSIAGIVSGALTAAFNAVTGAIGTAFNAARTFVDWLRANLPGSGGTGEGASSDPAGQEERRRNFQNRMRGLYENVQPQSFSPVTPGQMVGPSPVSAQQHNTINNNLTVNAGGNSGAEVHAGAQRAMAGGTRDMLAGLGGAARSLGMAMPRAEAAAA